MPIYIPFESHGRCLVALIAIKGHPKRIYHYSKTSGEDWSWAIRDYILGEIVRSGEETLSAPEIENLVDHAERPAYRSVASIQNWKEDCREASNRHYKAAQVDLSTGNPSTLGNWRSMNSQGS